MTTTPPLLRQSQGADGVPRCARRQAVCGQARRRRHRRRWDGLLCRPVERDTGAADNREDRDRGAVTRNRRRATGRYRRGVHSGVARPFPGRDPVRDARPSVLTGRGSERPGPAMMASADATAKRRVPVQPTEATTASAAAEPYLRPTELVYAVDEIPAGRYGWCADWKVAHEVAKTAAVQAQSVLTYILRGYAHRPAGVLRVSYERDRAARSILPIREPTHRRYPESHCAAAGRGS